MNDATPSVGPGGHEFVDPTRTPADPDAARTRLDVQALHHRPIAEHTDPRDGSEPIPGWALAVFAAVLMWGGYYLGVMSGAFRADVYDRPNPPPQGVTATLPPATPR